MRRVGTEAWTGPVEEPAAEIERRYASLTPREKETLELVVCGHTSRSAAQKLSISVRTVEVYRARIMDKMHARNTAELVRLTLFRPQTRIA